MTDITQVSRRLTDQAQAVAEMLLPGGRKEGAEWKAGSLAGEKGDSLGVHLTGAKAGVWADFATGEGGKDLIDLWAAVHRIPLGQALEAAKQYLGIDASRSIRAPKPSYSKPEKPKCTKPQDAVRLFLTEERNISGAAIEAYKVGESGRKMVFPYLRDGELVMVKFEGIDLLPSGRKDISSSSNTEDCLFGWQAIDAGAREVILVEGEKDALSMFDYGFSALSVPRGGGKGEKQKWIENEYERMERFERIYIATDMDQAGDEAAAEIASRLGRHRCYRVVLPLKDANACLMDGVSHEIICKCILEAKPLDPEGLKQAGVYGDKIVRLFWPGDGSHVGYSMPYASLHRKLLFRPAEVTLWSGSAGSGKSQLISDCIPKWIQEGSRICVASFEMKPEWTLKRLVKQTGGLDRPSEPFIRAILGWLDQGLLLYEKVGKSSIENMLEVFDYARAKYGCDQFVIDSLMRLGIAGDDYTGQEQAVYRMVDWTIANNVHLHLVAHSRKGERGEGPPETEDIKGAMEIGANAFNILTIWRDRKHEELLKTAQTDKEKALQDDKPGVILNVAKQRNGDFEGKVKLWFSQENYQYFSQADNRKWPRDYVKFVAKEIAA
jgi:twinkle protein